MKERPILFSSDMVRAYLEGRKTQTRRVITPRQEVKTGHNMEMTHMFTWNIWTGGMDDYESTVVRCPYGKIGDRLWVRETFSYYLNREGCWYWADGNFAAHDATPPKPSIHMPRWASRINFEITGRRVQRIQDIVEEDCIAEGAWNLERLRSFKCDFTGLRSDIRCSFAGLWDRLNAKRGYSWESNPWVWVIEFPPFRASKVDDPNLFRQQMCGSWDVRRDT